MTSRELLRIRGEVDYPVPPLAGSEAVELFCTRSRLEPSEEIAELCARLDDLPLAVELAAARTSVLSPRQILERLSQRLDLLRGGRDAEARQRTLRATIEWSYELLTEEEKRLFAALSVFAGGCTLEAAESVCDADLDALQSLVDKSLLRHTDERFWMLETIRELALERLEDSGGAEDLRRRYTAYFLELGELAKPELQDWSSSVVVRPARGGARQHPRRARRRARARPPPTSHYGSAPQPSSSGSRGATGARAAAGSSRLSPPRRSAPTRRRAPGRRPARGLAGGRRAGPRRVGGASRPRRGDWLDHGRGSTAC